MSYASTKRQDGSSSYLASESGKFVKDVTFSSKCSPKKPEGRAALQQGLARMMLGVADGIHQAQRGASSWLLHLIQHYAIT